MKQQISQFLTQVFNRGNNVSSILTGWTFPKHFLSNICNCIHCLQICPSKVLKMTTLPVAPRHQGKAVGCHGNPPIHKSYGMTAPLREYYGIERRGGRGTGLLHCFLLEAKTSNLSNWANITHAKAPWWIQWIQCKSLYPNMARFQCTNLIFNVLIQSLPTFY